MVPPQLAGSCLCFETLNDFSNWLSLGGVVCLCSSLSEACPADFHFGLALQFFFNILFFSPDFLFLTKSRFLLMELFYH